MKIILLAILFILSNQSHWGNIFWSNNSQVNVWCYLNNGYLDFAIVPLNQNLVPYANITQIVATGTIPDIILLPDYSDSPSDIVTKIINSLPQSHYNIIWLDLENHRGTPTCKYLQMFVSTAKFQNKQVGIYSEKDKWISNFGDQFACPSLGVVPLLQNTKTSK